MKISTQQLPSFILGGDATLSVTLSSVELVKKGTKLLTANYHDRGKILSPLTRTRAWVGGTLDKLPAQQPQTGFWDCRPSGLLKNEAGPHYEEGGMRKLYLHQTWALGAHINPSFFRCKISWHTLGTHWASSTEPSHFHACPLLPLKQPSSRLEEREIILCKYKYFFSMLKKDSRVTIAVTSLLFNKKMQNKGFNEINAFRKKRVFFIHQGLIKTLFGKKLVYYARHICVLTTQGFINILPPIHFPTLV